MDFAIITAVALVAAGLTFFSGFGLGTLLLPAFALFFPIEVAVAATAVVHLANNLFKFGLVRRWIDWPVFWRFALSAAALALLGAWILTLLSDLGVIARWSFGGNGRAFEITPVKLTIAVLIAIFAILDLSPRFERLAFPRTWLPLGGALSGFFGGLSGHQGALRSAFLIRCGLSKEAFIATSVAASVLVDAARLIVYGADFAAGGSNALDSRALWLRVAAATLAAFIGSLIGARLVKKVTLRAVQVIVAVGLLLLAAAMALGLV